MKLLKKFSPEIESRHYEALRRRVERGIKTIEEAANLENPREKAYCLALKTIGAKKLLLGDVCLLRRIVMFFDRILPQGDFLNPKKPAYSERFSVVTRTARKAFDYEYFCNTSDNDGKWGGWALAQESYKSLMYCPYCNAETLYAFKWKQNGKLRLAKSAFDHFFPRARYPFLGLSLYNLIPCCSRCNSTFKGSSSQDLAMTAHPYASDIDSKMRFHALLSNSYNARCGDEKGLVGMVFGERHYGSFMPGILWDRLFKVSDSYSSLYLRDVALTIARILRYPKSYINATVKRLDEVGLPIIDLETQLYGAPLDRKKINEYRFGKLIADIAETYRC